MKIRAYVLAFAASLGFAPNLATAQIALTGEAKMGLSHVNGKTNAAAGTRITARFSRVTDGGMEFGAIVDLDQTGTGTDAVFRGDAPRAQVFIASGNHSLRVGKAVDSATQSLMATQSLID